jgi:hypothetical protein
MKKLLSYAAAVAITLFSLGSHAYVVEFVGDNPFQAAPNTGGTGTFTCDTSGAIPDCTVEKDFTSLGVIPIVINGNGPGVVHISETVINNTGVTWTDFHIDYVSIDAVAFVLFSNFTNADWATLTTGPNFLTLEGSTIASGDGFELGFDVTVVTDGFALFALAQRPSVAPAPGTLALLGFALAGLGAFRRKLA